MHQEWEAKGVKFIGVDVWDGTPELLQTQFVDYTNSTYNFLTFGSSIGTLLGVGIHNYMIIGIDGTVKYIGYSFNTEPWVEQFSILTGTPGQKPKVVPETFTLQQNYPNPFNPQTTIEYELRVDAPVNVQLVVYDLLGKEIKTLVNDSKRSGFYTATWDGTNNQGQDVPSGFYFYALQAPGLNETKKMLLVR